MIDGNFLDSQTCIQQQLYEHFASEGYCNFIEDATITFIDNSDSKGPNQREHYWKHTLKTMAPAGFKCQRWLGCFCKFL